MTTISDDAGQTSGTEPADNTVLRHDGDGVATLTLSRPDKLNALTPPMFRALRAHVDDLMLDESIGCVVLTGAGRSFCAGNDLGGIASREADGGAADGGDSGAALPAHFQAETIDALERLPQPSIAAVRGHCFTGGLELALGCDLIVATESAQLGDTHGQWGLVAAWGMTVRLPERVGRATAKELMYTARRITGTEAAEIGLVNRSVGDDNLEAEVAELVTQILGNSWDTSRINKSMLADTVSMTRTEALAYERSAPYGRPRDMMDRLQR